MSALALSVLLSLVSAVAYAGGAIVQDAQVERNGKTEYVHRFRPHSQVRDRG